MVATDTLDFHKTAPLLPKRASSVPKTVAKAGVVAPAPSIKPAPKTSEPSPSTPAPVCSFADSNVELHIDNHFSDGTLSIWIDDKLTYQHPLHDGHKKKLILLGGGIKEIVTIPLPSGKHALRVQVKSVTEQYDESKSVTDEFPKGGEKILAITFDKHTKEMRLALSGDESPIGTGVSFAFFSCSLSPASRPLLTWLHSSKRNFAARLDSSTRPALATELSYRRFPRPKRGPHAITRRLEAHVVSRTNSTPLQDSRNRILRCGHTSLDV